MGDMGARAARAAPGAGGAAERMARAEGLHAPRAAQDLPQLVFARRPRDALRPARSGARPVDETRHAKTYTRMGPTPEETGAARARLGERIVQTPVWRWRGDEIEKLAGAQPLLKLELFQHAG